VDSLYAVHLVFPHFHVGTSNSESNPDCIQPPPLPIIVNDELEFEISKILTPILQLLMCLQATVSSALDRYEGTDEETSWILASELGHASGLIVDFHSAYPAKSGPLQVFESGIIPYYWRCTHYNNKSSLLSANLLLFWFLLQVSHFFMTTFFHPPNQK